MFGWLASRAPSDLTDLLRPAIPIRESRGSVVAPDLKAKNKQQLPHVGFAGRKDGKPGRDEKVWGGGQREMKMRCEGEREGDRVPGWECVGLVSIWDGTAKGSASALRLGLCLRLSAHS
jgi:hypothetical protein